MPSLILGMKLILEIPLESEPAEHPPEEKASYASPQPQQKDDEPASADGSPGYPIPANPDAGEDAA